MAGLRPVAALVMALVAIVIVGAGLVSAAAPASEPATTYIAELEHVVVRPVPADGPEGQSGGAGGSPQLAILDVMRLVGSGGEAPAGQLHLPLPPGYQELAVMSGLEPGSVQAGPRELAGRLAGAGEDGAVVVAITYRLPAVTAAGASTVMELARPFAVTDLFLMVHPGLSAAVSGAQEMGDVELQGSTYRAFVRSGLAAGTRVRLLIAPVAGQPGGGLAAGVLAAGGVVAVAAVLVGAWIVRRRRWGPAAPAPDDLAIRRAESGLLQALVALEGEHRAGYLSDDEYRARREPLLDRLGALRGAAGAAGAGRETR